MPNSQLVKTSLFCVVFLSCANYAIAAVDSKSNEGSSLQDSQTQMMPEQDYKYLQYEILQATQLNQLKENLHNFTLYSSKSYVLTKEQHAFVMLLLIKRVADFNMPKKLQTLQITNTDKVSGAQAVVTFPIDEIINELDSIKS